VLLLRASIADYVPVKMTRDVSEVAKTNIALAMARVRDFFNFKLGDSTNMSQTITLTLRSYDITAGTNSINPMGFVIRLFAFNDAGDQNLRLHFFSADAGTPTNLGFRASDNALALFLQRRDFASYVLALDQARATHIQVQIEDNNDTVIGFDLSTVSFPTIAPSKVMDLKDIEAKNFLK